MMHPRTLAVAISWAMFGSGSPMRKATRKLLAQFARHPSPSTRSAAWTVTESTSSTCAGVGSTTSMRTCALRHWCTRLRIMQARVTSRMTATQCRKSLRLSSSTTRPITTTSRKTSHREHGGALTPSVLVVGPSAPSLATPVLALARPSPACATIRRMARRSASSAARLAALATVHPKALCLHPPRPRLRRRSLSLRLEHAKTIHNMWTRGTTGAMSGRATGARGTNTAMSSSHVAPSLAVRAIRVWQLLRPRLRQHLFPRLRPHLRPLRHQRLRPRPHRHLRLHLLPGLHLVRTMNSTRTRSATSAKIGRDGVAQATGTVAS
mmetsp:Transcript_152249/g.486503  ORF Transcript_152249/g.486503 Transcript_152249/m.486503 type:complete len:323 (+) Transcript_152249:1493-2461(+)